MIVCAAVVPVTTSILAKLSLPIKSPAIAPVVTVFDPAPAVIVKSVPAFAFAPTATVPPTSVSSVIAIAPDDAFVVTRSPKKFVIEIVPAAPAPAPLIVRLTSSARFSASIVTASATLAWLAVVFTIVAATLV